MTQFEKFMAFDIDQLADWLNRYGNFDDSLWMQWWNSTYCKNCESLEVDYEDLDMQCYFGSQRKAKCAYCEIHPNCKYFPNLLDIPDNKEIIKMWLNTQCLDRR